MHEVFRAMKALTFVSVSISVTVSMGYNYNMFNIDQNLGGKVTQITLNIKIRIAGMDMVSTCCYECTVSLSISD